MTETNPSARWGQAAQGPPREEELTWRVKQGRPLAGRAAAHRRRRRRRAAWDGEPWASSRCAAVGRGALRRRTTRRTSSRRRLAAYRRRRDHRRPRATRRSPTGQGRHQVRRRVDQLGRSGEHADEPSRRARGRGVRRAGRALGRAAAGVPGPAGGRRADARGAARVARRARWRDWWLPERWTLHRRGAEDERREVRQEAAASPLRRGRPRRGDRQEGAWPSVRGRHRDRKAPEHGRQERRAGAPLLRGDRSTRAGSSLRTRSLRGTIAITHR